MDFRNLRATSKVLSVFRLRKDEEKIPFANDASKRKSGTFLQAVPNPENGQISKEKDKNSVESSSDEAEVPDAISVNEKDKEPMSNLRKACFFSSFSVWILYFAVFLWFIPCRDNNCLQLRRWSTSFQNMELTTDLAAIDGLLIFGYKNASFEIASPTEGMIMAINSKNGDVVWTRMLKFIPLRIHCSVSSATNLSACTAIGKAKFVSFISSNGKKLWEQDFSPDFIEEERMGILLCDLSPSPLITPADVWTDVSPYQFKLLQLDVSNKVVTLHLLSLPTHCEEMSLKHKSINLGNKNESHLVFICIRQHKIADLWTISRKNLCSLRAEENATVDDEQFDLLYSIKDFTSYPESILLTDAENSGILISSANTVVLISKEIPHAELWRHVIYNSSLIASIVPGHFTSKTQNEVAVVVQGENFAISIYILRLLDGSEVSSTSMDGMVKSVAGISNKLHQGTDSLLLETEANTNSSNTPPSLQELLKTYDVDEGIHFHKQDSIFSMIGFENSISNSPIITSISLQSKVIVIKNEDVELMLAEGRPNFQITFSDYSLKANAQNGCRS